MRITAIFYEPNSPPARSLNRLRELAGAQCVLNDTHVDHDEHEVHQTCSLASY